MYAQQSIQDSLFLMFYGAIAILALVSGLFLWLRRSNVFAPDINPPIALRRWTAAFFIMASLSHVWWYVLGVYWLTDDRLVRNITAVTLDHVLLVPLVMAILLRMLQNRHRPLWPWFLSQLPIIVSAVIGIMRHDGFYGFDLTTYWQLAVMVIFTLYYIHELIHYGRWLRDNYADLEHKEVWQSLLFVTILFFVYEVYFTNPGEMFREYLAQFETLAIIGFLLWRVETLQTLSDKQSDIKQVEEPAPLALPTSINIQKELQTHCEDKRLYLQHDLTLQQLAAAIGTNRTYLSNYFAQQGITYNAYINRLRIDHFMHLYRDAAADSRPVTAMKLSQQSGFSNYNTFAAAFKRFVGTTVTEWVQQEDAKEKIIEKT